MRRKLTKSEENNIYREVAVMNDEQLEKAFSDLLFSDILGSQADKMEELCYDEADIRERRKYEDYCQLKGDLLEKIMSKRGIDYWKGFGEQYNAAPLPTKVLGDEENEKC